MTCASDDDPAGSHVCQSARFCENPKVFSSQLPEPRAGTRRQRVIRIVLEREAMGETRPDARATGRRTILRLGALGGAGVAFGAVQGVVKPSLSDQAWLSPDGA